MTIRYKTPTGEIVEVEGRLFVCQDRNRKDVYEGDFVVDRRDNKHERMTERLWFLSLDEESEHIELIEDHT